MIFRIIVNSSDHYIFGIFVSEIGIYWDKSLDSGGLSQIYLFLSQVSCDISIFA